MKKFWGFLFLIAGGLAAWLAISYIFWQQRAIHEFIPVDAQIITAEVEVHHGSKGSTSYSPEITYQYNYKGIPYTSTQVLTFSAEASQSWADDIVSRYGGPTMQLSGIESVPFKAIAYIDPANPQDSILVREYSAQPYVFTVISLLVAAIGGGLITNVVGNPRTKMSALALDDSGWQLLLPTNNLRRGYHSAVAIFIAVALALLPPLLHWLFIARQLTLLTYPVAAGIAIVLVLLLVLVFRRWNVSRHISDARLRVRPAPMQRGEPFAIELEADALSSLHVKQARCRIVCTEHYRERRGSKTQVGTRKKGEQTAILSDRVEIPAGQVLAGKGELRFEKENWPPSTDTTGTTSRTYPYYTWEAFVEVELDAMVDYKGQFPLAVN